MIESLSQERRIKIQLKSKSTQELLELQHKLEKAHHLDTVFALLLKAELEERSWTDATT